MMGKKLGEGNTAEVYLWKDNNILKLFRDNFPKDEAEREFRINKAVEKLGLPIPEAGEIIELNGRKGITYERISGMSMLDFIAKKPMSVRKYGYQLAGMHYKIHQCKVPGLPCYKENLERKIRKTGFLTEEQKDAVLKVLKELPEGDTLCHGDFHPGNIMIDNDRLVILDWLTAAAGCPAADAARTLMLIKDAAVPGNIPGFIRILINLGRRRLADAYLNYYRELSGITEDEINQWRLPMIAARLTEWIPDIEKDRYLKEIRKILQQERK